MIKQEPPNRAQIEEEKTRGLTDFQRPNYKDKILSRHSGVFVGSLGEEPMKFCFYCYNDEGSGEGSISYACMGWGPISSSLSSPFSAATTASVVDSGWFFCSFF